MTRNAKRQHTIEIGVLGLGIVAASIGCGGCSTATPRQATIAAPSSFVFWPPFPNDPHVQFLRSFANSSDVEPALKLSKIDRMVFGDEAESVLPITKPFGLDMWEAKIFVCDSKTNSVTILDLANQDVRVMGTTGLDSLEQPGDIAVSDDGYKYVTDRALQLVLAYDQEERFAAKFAVKGFIPVSIAVHGDELYVGDAKSSQVLVLDRFTGKERRRIGKVEPESERELGLPIGVEVDASGNVFVSDVIKSDVKRFNAEGELEHTYGFLADTSGAFRRPKQIAVDREGFLYVVDAAFQNIQIIRAEDGQVMTFFGGATGMPGSMYLPAGVAVEEFDDVTREIFAPYIHPAFNARRLILVTNQFGPNKVSVYALGELKEGKTVDDIAPSRLEVPSGINPNPPTDPVVPSDLSPDETGDIQARDGKRSL